MYQNDPLDELERIQLENWLIASVRSREFQYLQYRNGQLDAQTWNAFLSVMSATLVHPRTRAWWKAVSIEYFDDDYVRGINRYLEKYPVIENYRSPIEGI